MLSITSAQLDVWIASFAYPLSRILALVSTVPLWGTAILPRRLRLMLGLAIALAITPVLPPVPTVSPATWQGIGLIAQQMLIGIGMGLAVRIVFAAVDIAGEFIGFQMGLSFATAYDPLSSSQTPVISEFLGLINMLLFLSLNGHLMFIATLAKSFYILPVGSVSLSAYSWLNLVELGTTMFATGLLLALPVIVALMITNLALAVLTRAAPQLNIFALGFPLTLTGGFIALAIAMNYLSAPLQQMYEFALNAMLAFPVPASQ